MRWIWVLPLAAIAVHVILIRYNSRAVRRDWEAMLHPTGQRLLEELRLQHRLDAGVADDMRERVSVARRREDYTQAMHLVELGTQLLVEATPNRLARLRGMAVCARMASAMLPVEPLHFRRFELRELATIAGLGAVLHNILLTTTERFVLKLQILALGFKLVTRALGHTADAARVVPVQREAYDRFERAAADWTTLDVEHVEAFKVLVTSLAAHPKRALS
jgi:hypothetical protein